MSLPSKDMADILVTDVVQINGENAEFGVNLFVGIAPKSPDAVVVVLDTGGFDPDAATDYKRPTIQVLVRGAKNGYQAAYVLAQAVVTSLHALSNKSQGDSRYSAWQEGDIISVGNDENDRPILTTNFRLHKTTI